MKCPLSQEGRGKPLSPGWSSIVVGPSAPLRPSGIINTESVRSDLLRASRETIRTQWRWGGSPRLAIQISARLAVKVYLLSRPAERGSQFSLLCGSARRQPSEVGSSGLLKPRAIRRSPGRLHSHVHRLCDARGFSRIHQHLEKTVGVSRNRGRQLMSWHYVLSGVSPQPGLVYYVLSPC